MGHEAVHDVLLHYVTAYLLGKPQACRGDLLVGIQPFDRREKQERVTQVGIYMHGHIAPCPSYVGRLCDEPAVSLHNS